MKLLRIIPILCLLALQPTSAQTAAHKTYSGPYLEGTATYSYLEAEDGTRIFDGNFTYKNDREHLTWSGNLKNDLQVGTWTITLSFPNILVPTYLKTVTTYTFDDKGLKTGPVVEKVYFKNGTVIVTETSNLDEGVRDGKYSYVDWTNTNHTVKGEFQQGIPIGKWVKTSNDEGTVTYDYDNQKDGRPQVIEFDRATGDKKVSFKGLDVKLATGLYTMRKSAMAYVNKTLYEYLGCRNNGGPTNDYSDFFIKNTNFTPETYPAGAVANVRCIIEKDGTLSDIRIYQGVNDTVDAKITRFLKEMKHTPKMSEPSYNEEPVPQRTYLQLKIEFNEYVIKYMNKDIERKKQAATEAAAAKAEDEMLANEPDPIEISEADVKPEYPGGESAMMKYISEKMRYPSSALENGIQGRVMIRFVIRSDGSIGFAKVVRGKDESLDKEAVRIIESMPRFTPAQKDGKPVPVWYTCPVVFRLSSSNATPAKSSDKKSGSKKSLMDGWQKMEQK